MPHGPPRGRRAQRHAAGAPEGRRRAVRGAGAVVLERNPLFVVCSCMFFLKTFQQTIGGRYKMI